MRVPSYSYYQILVLKTNSSVFINTYGEESIRRSPYNKDNLCLSSISLINLQSMEKYMEPIRCIMCSRNGQPLFILFLIRRSMPHGGSIYFIYMEKSECTWWW